VYRRIMLSIGGSCCVCCVFGSFVITNSSPLDLPLTTQTRLFFDSLKAGNEEIKWGSSDALFEWRLTPHTILHMTLIN